MIRIKFLFLSVFLPQGAEKSYPICILRKSPGVYNIIERRCDLSGRQKTAQGRPVGSPVQGVDAGAGADRENGHERIEIEI